MERYEQVCPVEYAGGLDVPGRRLLQNPARILKGRVREGMTVLELGCGSGFFTTEAARLVGKSGKVIAADLQEGMLDLVRKRLKGTDLEGRVQLHQCEADRIGVAEKVDLILAFLVIHEVPDKRRLFSELKTLLKPGGRLYVIELKFHPPRRNFEETVRIAGGLGLRELERPRSLLSRAIILGT